MSTEKKVPRYYMTITWPQTRPGFEITMEGKPHNTPELVEQWKQKIKKINLEQYEKEHEAVVVTLYVKHADGRVETLAQVKVPEEV